MSTHAICEFSESWRCIHTKLDQSSITIEDSSTFLKARVKVYFKWKTSSHQFNQSAEVSCGFVQLFLITKRLEYITIQHKIM